MSHKYRLDTEVTSPVLRRTIWTSSMFTDNYQEVDQTIVDRHLKYTGSEYVVHLKVNVSFGYPHKRFDLLREFVIE